MSARGTTNKNVSGSSYDRRRRKQWLLSPEAGFGGDGETVPCSYCRVGLTFATLTVDRVVPGALGGRYTRDNVQPACGSCNSREGCRLRALLRAAVAC